MYGIVLEDMHHVLTYNFYTLWWLGYNPEHLLFKSFSKGMSFYLGGS